MHMHEIPKYNYDEFKELVLNNSTLARRLRFSSNRYLLDELIYHTPHISSESVNQRIYHIINDLTDIPVCPHCPDKRSWNKDKIKYNNTCGNSRCVRSAGSIAYIATMQHNYGVSNIFSSELFKEKLKAHNQAMHGVDHFVQSTEFHTKYVNHMQQVYGTDHYLQNTDKACNHWDKLHSSNGKYPQQKHIHSTRLSLLDDVAWLSTQHHTNERTIHDIARELDVDKNTVATRMRQYGIDIKRYTQSTAEKELTKFIEASGEHVVTSDRTILPDKLELDIYIPSCDMAIEYCGLYWHSDAVRKTAKHMHETKYNLCKERGIRLFTIFESEWIDRNEIVKKTLLNALHKNPSKKIYARHTSVAPLTTKQKARFLDAYHIQGNGPSSIHYGLLVNSELVAVIGFVKTAGYFVLNRYATSCQVVGGFTKLLKHFEREFSVPPKIITFADLRWSNGELYINSGFTLDSKLPPDYYWTKGRKLWHKFNWRHTSGLKSLPNYDSALSESENMRAHGYAKLWDCGKLRFIKN